MLASVEALARRHGLSDEVAAAVNSLVTEVAGDAPSTLVPEGWGAGVEGASQRVAADRRAGTVMFPGPVGAPSRGFSPPDSAERYVDLGLIGRGGMGEVRRVFDRALNRTAAMKVAHTTLPPSALARFVEEAQATSQLQHPGIVPVYDAGRHPDGWVWFTMQEVRGDTLAQALSTAAADPHLTPWTLRRLMSAFHAVCHAVAFAHERGVVHRDLKPDNVMVGRHGEVWG